MNFYPQAPASVAMIRPHHFSPNPQTADDNSFQAQQWDMDNNQLSTLAYQQMSNAVGLLEQEGIRVHLFEDETKDTPDSVFPNNWFSTHAGGYIGVYPMYAKNRRLERRQDIIDELKREYIVQEVVDYSGLEYDQLYLEGTGSMVLDHIERIAYATESYRTSPVALERFCAHFNYEPMIFKACDANDIPVYHTNVLMCIATEFALIGDTMMQCEDRKQEVLTRLSRSGRQVISLTEQQINQFAGNAIELTGKAGRVLVISQTAFNSLTEEQKNRIEQSCRLLPIDVSAIELAGGSIRCMIAGIHLSKR